MIYNGKIDSDITDNILSNWECYKNNSLNLCDISRTCTHNGIQTKNVLLLSDFQNNQFIKSLNRLLEICKSILKLNISFHYVHFVEYFADGYQSIHNHKNHEDFSLILYLNTCESGETYFESGNTYLPIKNNIVLFSSYHNHGANFINAPDNKKVLVCGFRRTLNYE